MPRAGAPTTRWQIATLITRAVAGFSSSPTPSWLPVMWSRLSWQCGFSSSTKIRPLLSRSSSSSCRPAVSRYTDPHCFLVCRRASLIINADSLPPPFPFFTQAARQQMPQNTSGFSLAASTARHPSHSSGGLPQGPGAQIMPPGVDLGVVDLSGSRYRSAPVRSWPSLIQGQPQQQHPPHRSVSSDCTSVDMLAQMIAAQQQQQVGSSRLPLSLIDSCMRII